MKSLFFLVVLALVCFILELYVKDVIGNLPDIQNVLVVLCVAALSLAAAIAGRMVFQRRKKKR